MESVRLLAVIPPWMDIAFWIPALIVVACVVAAWLYIRKLPKW